MKSSSGVIYCDVMGCGEEADHIDEANPFDLSEKCDLCGRCWTAGVESVERGYSEMPTDIYRNYYGLNAVGPSGYGLHKELKGEEQ